MSRSNRNADKPRVTEAEARANIIAGCKKAGYVFDRGSAAAIRRPGNDLASKSELAYMAFPDYTWGRPQGAAFSVAAIVRRMERDELIRYTYLLVGGGMRIHGYQITRKAVKQS